MHTYLSQKGNIKYNRFEAVVKPHFFGNVVAETPDHICPLPTGVVCCTLVGREQRRA